MTPDSKRYYYKKFYISIEQWRDDEKIPWCDIEVVRPDGREVNDFPFSNCGYIWEIQEKVEKFLDSLGGFYMHSKITNYKIVTSEVNQLHLEKNVKNFIKEGWEPLGGPFYYFYDGGLWLAQAMIFKQSGFTDQRIDQKGE